MPTIYCITNEVSANFVANALLAIGASPIMSSAIEEVDDLCAIADALLLNIGTPSQAQFQTMLAAGKRMHELGKPIVLDPVGVNATHYRLELAQTLIREVHPTVIKGNASEILALATNTVLHTGLDNSQLSNLETTLNSIRLADRALQGRELSTLNSIANDLAKSVGAVVVISGSTDYITDGTHTASVTLGSPDMAKTTGTGCVASAVIAAYLTSKLLNQTATLHSTLSTLNSTIKAMTLMGQAGEDMPHFLDRLSAFSA
ncbi:MAG: hydroxyethylthiazole kinase [Paludibacteraceae bacterium]|nr:hydroxyethylthiazole kinase [Paludibacteraceae bacterium]